LLYSLILSSEDREQKGIKLQIGLPPFSSARWKLWTFNFNGWVAT